MPELGMGCRWASRESREAERPQVVSVLEVTTTSQTPPPAARPLPAEAVSSTQMSAGIATESLAGCGAQASAEAPPLTACQAPAGPLDSAADVGGCMLIDNSDRKSYRCRKRETGTSPLCYAVPRGRHNHTLQHPPIIRAPAVGVLVKNELPGVFVARFFVYKGCTGSGRAAGRENRGGVRWRHPINTQRDLPTR